MSFRSNWADDVPLLFVDVNLGAKGKSRIVLYDGDTPDQVADKFAKKHSKSTRFLPETELESAMKERLVKLLKDQLEGVLTKIPEEGMDSDK